MNAHFDHTSAALAHYSFCCRGSSISLSDLVTGGLRHAVCALEFCRLSAGDMRTHELRLNLHWLSETAHDQNAFHNGSKSMSMMKSSITASPHRAVPSCGGPIRLDVVWTEWLMGFLHRWVATTFGFAVDHVAGAVCCSVAAAGTATSGTKRLRISRAFARPHR